MHRIVDAATGRPLVGRVQVARRIGPRAALGLIGRRGLGPGDGLLLADPLGCVHTVGMRFPIDVVFLDRGLVVRAVAESVPPFRIVRRRGGPLQLELAAGRARALGLIPGRRLALWPAGVRDRGESPQVELRPGEPAHDPAARPCDAVAGVSSVPARSGPDPAARGQWAPERGANPSGRSM